MPSEDPEDAGMPKQLQNEIRVPVEARVLLEDRYDPIVDGQLDREISVRGRQSRGETSEPGATFSSRPGALTPGFLMSG